MKIAVFGASGPTGRQVVSQALGAGHEVTAFVRNPAAFDIAHERLRVVVGDTLKDDSKVAEAIRGQDVVVCSLGVAKTFSSGNLIRLSLQSIVSAMERNNVRRLVHVSAFGVGDSKRHAPLLPRIMYRLLLSDIFADKKAAEGDLARSSIDWIVVYPTALTNGPLTGTYRVGERLELTGALPKISRADVAHWILTQLEAREYLRKVAVISY
jgi:putative NADH-flavin reductase